MNKFNYILIITALFLNGTSYCAVVGGDEDALLVAKIGDMEARYKSFEDSIASGTFSCDKVSFSEIDLVLLQDIGYKRRQKESMSVHEHFPHEFTPERLCSITNSNLTMNDLKALLAPWAPFHGWTHFNFADNSLRDGSINHLIGLIWNPATKMIDLRNNCFSLDALAALTIINKTRLEEPISLKLLPQKKSI